MRFRGLAVAFLLLSTGGCSYHHDIVATEQSGLIVFKPAKETGSGCFSYFSVRDQSGGVVWELRAENYIPPPCNSKFPITYGVKPSGMKEQIKPLQLKAGNIYKVEGWDGDNYSGTFRFKQGIIVENLSAAR